MYDRRGQKNTSDKLSGGAPFAMQICGIQEDI